MPNRRASGRAPLGLTWRAGSLAAVVMMVMLLLQACSNDSTETGSSTSPSASGSSSSGVQTAKDRIAAVSGVPQLVIPSSATPFDASQASGKSVWYINTNDALPVSVIWRDAAVKALEAYGVKVTTFDGKGSVTEYNRGFQSAISQGADLIFMLAVTPQSVAVQIEKAAAQGIPVVSATDGVPEVTQNADYIPGMTAEVSYDYAAVGALQADWFIADSEGKGHALFISNLDQPSAIYVMNGFTAEVEALCPDCSIIYKDVPAATAATVLPTLVPTTLNANPDINYIIPDYDFQIPAISSSLKQAGMADGVRIGSWNAVPPVMVELKDSSSPVYMDMGAPNQWFADAIADTIMRTLVGEEPFVWGTADSNYMGFRMFTKENVQSIDVTEYNDEVVYGLSPEEVDSGFQTLWGTP